MQLQEYYSEKIPELGFTENTKIIVVGCTDINTFVFNGLYFP